MKKLRVTVNGKVYEVTVEELETAHPSSGEVRVVRPVTAMQPALSSPAQTTRVPAAGQAGDVPSPLAGKVVAINCAKGDEVEAGATLVTLEAMKMNTFVPAPAAGKVVEIYVQEGDSVEEGQPLVALG